MRNVRSRRPGVDRRPERAAALPKRPVDAQVLLAAVESPAQRPEDEAILSEILALRKIVINLLYGQVAGEPLSEERMQERVEAAESEKLRKAAERLRAGTDSTSWSLER